MGTQLGGSLTTPRGPGGNITQGSPEATDGLFKSKSSQVLVPLGHTQPPQHQMPIVFVKTLEIRIFGV